MHASSFLFYKHYSWLIVCLFELFALGFFLEDSCNDPEDPPLADIILFGFSLSDFPSKL